MTTVYLDTCSPHRPLDDKTQARIAVEAEAIIAVLSFGSSRSGRVNYFCTCDDRLLKKAKTRADIARKVVSPPAA